MQSERGGRGGRQGQHCRGLCRRRIRCAGSRRAQCRDRCLHHRCVRTLRLRQHHLRLRHGAGHGQRQRLRHRMLLRSARGHDFGLHNYRLSRSVAASTGGGGHRLAAAIVCGPRAVPGAWLTVWDCAAWLAWSAARPSRLTLVRVDADTQREGSQSVCRQKCSDESLVLPPCRHVPSAARVSLVHCAQQRRTHGGCTRQRHVGATAGVRRGKARSEAVPGGQLLLVVLTHQSSDRRRHLRSAQTHAAVQQARAKQMSRADSERHALCDLCRWPWWLQRSPRLQHRSRHLARLPAVARSRSAAGTRRRREGAT